jgi:hypothetical protein
MRHYLGSFSHSLDDLFRRHTDGVLGREKLAEWGTLRQHQMLIKRLSKALETLAHANSPPKTSSLWYRRHGAAVQGQRLLCLRGSLRLTQCSTK